MQQPVLVLLILQQGLRSVLHAIGQFAGHRKWGLLHRKDSGLQAWLILCDRRVNVDTQTCCVLHLTLPTKYA